MIIIVAVCSVMVFSMRMFDRRQIEAGTDGYEELDSPTPVPNEEEEVTNVFTEGLFLGDENFVNYNTNNAGDS